MKISVPSSFRLPLYAIICATLWGSAFPAIKTAYRHFDASEVPNTLAWAGIRFFCAGLMILVFIPGKQWSKVKHTPKLRLFAVAFTQVILQYGCFYSGIQRISGVLASIIIASGSFWWVIIAPIFKQSHVPGWKEFALLSLGFFGVCICIYDGSLGYTTVLGAFLMCMASLSGTCAGLMVRPLNQYISTPLITGLSLGGGGLTLIFFFPKPCLQLLQTLPWSILGLTLYLSFVSAAAFSLWFHMITQFDVMRLSLYRLLIPVFGVLESAYFLNEESVTWPILYGGCLVIGSIYLLERLKRKTIL